MLFKMLINTISVVIVLFRIDWSSFRVHPERIVRFVTLPTLWPEAKMDLNDRHLDGLTFVCLCLTYFDLWDGLVFEGGKSIVLFMSLH